LKTQAYPDLLLCHGCDAVYRRRALVRGEKARCLRCGSLLGHGAAYSLSTWLALVVTTTVVFIFANTFPVAVISLGGLEGQATIWQSVVALSEGPGAPVAVTAALITIGIPALQLGTLLWVLSFAVRGRSCPGFVAAMRILRVSKPWGMVEVCLLAILVALVKLSGFVHVVAGVGVAATVVLAPLMAVVTNRNIEDLWALPLRPVGMTAAAGAHASTGAPAPASIPAHTAKTDLMACHLCERVCDGRARAGHVRIECSRCGSHVSPRKPEAWSRACAFLVAALVLYIPANTLPVMYTRLLGSAASSTILGGVIEFWRSGSWDIALLIFTASVVVPCTKFIALGVLLIDTRHQIGSRPGKTRLLRFVESIGYWSMLDVLVVALVTALIQFKAVGTAEPRLGIVFFGAVVVLTMLAAMSFDGRLAWDEGARHD
jgi:paraquat-inducible protein A